MAKEEAIPPRTIAFICRDHTLGFQAQTRKVEPPFMAYLQKENVYEVKTFKDCRENSVPI